jgi:hypothetical protein
LWNPANTAEAPSRSSWTQTFALAKPPQHPHARTGTGLSSALSAPPIKHRDCAAIKHRERAYSELHDDLGFLSSHIGFLRRVDLFRSSGCNFFLRRADVYGIWPMSSGAPASPPDKQRSKQLPTTRPKGLGPKAWLAAQEVYRFRREGNKWIDIEHDLLSKIRERLGGDKWLSIGTLKTALAYLKKKGLIDL